MLRQLRQIQHHERHAFRSLWTSSRLGKEENTVKKEWYSPPTEIKRESWNIPIDKRAAQVPENEWRGFFHHFVPQKNLSVDLMSLLQKGIDFRPKAFRKIYSNMKADMAISDQKFKAERVAAVGFELGAAHFLVHRGARVRFKGAKGWLQRDEDGLYEMERHYHPGVFLEEINMAEFTYIVYEGLESMKNLKELKTLNMANCSNIDDWCIDRICGEYHKTLEHLDLSNCTRVTERGVAALARLSALKSLNLSGLDQVKDIKLLCLLLEDVLPSIKISGIDYLAPQALNQS